MVPIGGLYEAWGGLGNPAMYFMMGMIILPMLAAYYVSRGQLGKKDKKYEQKKAK